jgi:hypothetical protein
MATLDNIYHPNERNRWFYQEEGKYLEVCPINIVDDMHSHLLLKEKTVEENLKVKHYIKIGEECPLCYEPILYKKNAFLTDCGHSFHLSCIHSYEMANLFRSIYCPMCRSDMGIWGESGKIYFNSRKGLDKLEDFWNNISYERPTECLAGNHIKGLNKNCERCIHYRKKGR